MSAAPAPAAEAAPGSTAARVEAVVLRSVFAGLVVLTALVIGGDLRQRLDAEAAAPSTDAPWPQAEPYLPSTRPDTAAPGAGPGRTPGERLRAPMTLELVANGRLAAVGTITPGTAERFAEELAVRGGYVKTVVLDSPGGSVQDALKMGRLVRDRGLDTLVEGGALCASSCPIVLAGGVARRAAADAAVGVHQITAVRTDGVLAGLAPREPEAVETQRVSAEIQRQLVDMGVDAEVWFHAMETPPREMYYFAPEELATLKLAGPAD